MTISSDLPLDKHVAICCAGFYWLRQLRRVRRSLYTDSIKTAVRAFVMSRVDYCNAVFCRITKKAALCTERCSASRHWHTQVRPRLVTVATWGIALARRPRTYPLQTGSHSASLSAIQGSCVPDECDVTQVYRLGTTLTLPISLLL